MSSPALKDSLSRLPDKPGIYFFKNSRKEIIYIGKALSLRDRVRSYFQDNADEKAKELEAKIRNIYKEIEQNKI